MIDIYKVRKDTPSCENQLFFNSAGSSLMPTPVLKRMHDYQLLESEIGGYAAAATETGFIAKFYGATAELLNTNQNNIAFVYNATDGYSKAVSSIPFVKDDIILTTDDDYISNHLLFLSLKKRWGIDIIRCKNLPSGDLDIYDMEVKIKKYLPKLVSVTHIPTNSGKIQPVEQVGELCSLYDIWYIVDACQSVGQISVDVQKIKCDFLSATGRKFLRGPRGTGFLFISDKALLTGLEPLLIDMEGALWTLESEYTSINGAKRFECWEKNYVNQLGLTESVQYANSIGIDNISDYNDQLIKHLKNGLQSISNIRVTENGSKSGSIVTFMSKNRSLEQIKTLLNSNHVSYTVGLRSFALIDFNKKNIDWAIRLSPHYFNTFEEIEKVLDFLD